MCPMSPSHPLLPDVPSPKYLSMPGAAAASARGAGAAQQPQCTPDHISIKHLIASVTAPHLLPYLTHLSPSRCGHAWSSCCVSQGRRSCSTASTHSWPEGLPPVPSSLCLGRSNSLLQHLRPSCRVRGGSDRHRDLNSSVLISCSTACKTLPVPLSLFVGAQQQLTAAPQADVPGAGGSGPGELGPAPLGSDRGTRVFDK